MKHTRNLIIKEVYLISLAAHIVMSNEESSTGILSGTVFSERNNGGIVEASDIASVSTDGNLSINGTNGGFEEMDGSHNSTLSKFSLKLRLLIYWVLLFFIC